MRIAGARTAVTIVECDIVKCLFLKNDISEGNLRFQLHKDDFDVSHTIFLKIKPV